jgi:hypothetical protein
MMVVRPLQGERAQFTNNGIAIAVIFGGRHHAHCAIPGAEDNDCHHKGAGEVEGHCVGICKGLFRLLLWKRGPFPARQAPDVSAVTAITLQARAGKAASSRSGPFMG